MQTHQEAQQTRRKRLHKTIREAPERTQPIARAEWVGRLVGEVVQKQSSQQTLEQMDRLVHQIHEHRQTIQGWKNFGNPFWIEAPDQEKLLQRLEEVRQQTVEWEKHLDDVGLLTEQTGFWTRQAWGRLERGKAVLAEGYTPRVYQKFFETRGQQRPTQFLSVGLAATRTLQDLDLTPPDLRRGLLQVEGVAQHLRTMEMYSDHNLWVQGIHHEQPEGAGGEFEAQLRW